MAAPRVAISGACERTKKRRRMEGAHGIVRDDPIRQALRRLVRISGPGTAARISRDHGVNQAALSLYLNRQGNLSDEVIARVARALGCEYTVAVTLRMRRKVVRVCR